MIAGLRPAQSETIPGATPDTDTIRLTARQGPLFAGLPDDIAARLLAAACVRRVPQSTALFHQGDAPRHLLQVVSGLVKMTQINAGGAQTTLRMMGPGGLLGCVAVFQQFPYPATATALADTVAISWRAPAFLDLMKQHPPVIANALSVVGNRAREMLQKVVETSSRGVEQRIASALARLAEQAGIRTMTGILIKCPVGRADLAAMAGVTYFTVSRTLSNWQSRGLVKGGRQRIVILAAERLAEIAEGRKA